MPIVHPSPALFAGGVSSVPQAQQKISLWLLKPESDGTVCQSLVHSSLCLLAEEDSQSLPGLPHWPERGLPRSKCEVGIGSLAFPVGGQCGPEQPGKAAWRRWDWSPAMEDAQHLERRKGSDQVFRPVFGRMFMFQGWSSFSFSPLQFFF